MFKSVLRTPAVRQSALSIARPSTLRLIPSRVSSIRNYSDHHEETFEEFTARFEKEFDQAYDLFEVQRVLNNAFSYDLVPSPSVIERALKASRRVNDFATAVRVFEGLKYKVENVDQYNAYLDELKDVRAELGITLKEDLFPELANKEHHN
jgi:cytochrome c oxidase subunit 5a